MPLSLYCAYWSMDVIVLGTDQDWTMPLFWEPGVITVWNEELIFGGILAYTDYVKQLQLYTRFIGRNHYR